MSFESVQENVALLLKFLNHTDLASPTLQNNFPPNTAVHAASSWFLNRLSAGSNTLEVICEPISPCLYSNFHSSSEKYLSEAFEEFEEQEPSLLQIGPLIKYPSFAPTVCSHKSAVFDFYKQMMSQVVLWQIRKPKTLTVKKILQSPEFCKSMLALCIEVYFLLLDLQSIGIAAIISTFKINALDVWKQLDCFTNCYSDFPSFFLKHLKEIEKKILIDLVWEPSSPVLDAIRNQMNLGFKLQKAPYFRSFCARLNKVVSFRVERVSEYFALEHKTRAKLWRSTKYFMTRNFDSVISLDFVIICSLFCIVKKFMHVSLHDLALIYSEVFFGVAKNPICCETLNKFFKDSFLPLMDLYLTEVIKIQDSAILPLDPKKCYLIQRQMLADSVGFNVRRMQSIWGNEARSHQELGSLNFNFNCY